MIWGEEEAGLKMNYTMEDILDVAEMAEGETKEQKQNCQI